MTTILVLACTFHIGSAMLLVALPYFMLNVFQSDPASENPACPVCFSRLVTAWSWGAFLFQALSGAVWFWLVAVQMTGQSLETVPNLSDLATVLGQTHFGKLWLVRLAIGLFLGVVLLVCSLRNYRRSTKLSVSTWLQLLLGSALLLTLAWAGHAAAGVHDHTFHVGIDILHLLTGSVWPMGLVPLSLFLWSYHLEDETSRGNARVKVLTTFSRASLVAVLILLSTGLVNGCLMIGTWHDLVTTNYGKLLLVKVLAVLIMIAMGAYNRLALLSRLDEGAFVFRCLRRTVLAESCLAAGVLVIVGMMGMTPPPS